VQANVLIRRRPLGDGVSGGGGTLAVQEETGGWMGSMRPFRRKRSVDDVATREANLVAQIHIYEALAKAMDRRREVFDLLVASDDRGSAQSDLQALLEIDEVSAQAVMDLQLRRLPAAERSRIRVALAEMQANLHQVRCDLTDEGTHGRRTPETPGELRVLARREDRRDTHVVDTSLRSELGAREVCGLSAPCASVTTATRRFSTGRCVTWSPTT
jgi:hypothetical protein